MSDATVLRVRQLFTELVDQRMVKHVAALEENAARAKAEQFKIVQQSLTAAKELSEARSPQHHLPHIAAATESQSQAAIPPTMDSLAASAAAVSAAAATPAAPPLWMEPDSSDGIDDAPHAAPCDLGTIDLTGASSEPSSDSESSCSSESDSGSESASSSDESASASERKRSGRAGLSPSERSPQPNADASGVAPMELDDAVEVHTPEPAVSHHPIARDSKGDAAVFAAPLQSSGQPERKNEMEETKETGAALASVPAAPLMPANELNAQLQRPCSPAGAMAIGAGSENREPTGAVAALAPPSLSPILGQHETIPAQITRSATKLPSIDKEPQKRQLQQGKHRRADSAAEAMAAAPPAGLPLPADHATAASAANPASAPGQTDAVAMLSNAKDRSVQELLTHSLEEMEAEMAAAGSPLSDTGQSKWSSCNRVVAAGAPCAL